jgi:hypothetical protein
MLAGRRFFGVEMSHIESYSAFLTRHARNPPQGWPPKEILCLDVGCGVWDEDEDEDEDDDDDDADAGCDSETESESQKKLSTYMFLEISTYAHI